MQRLEGSYRIPKDVAVISLSQSWELTCYQPVLTWDDLVGFRFCLALGPPFQLPLQISLGFLSSCEGSMVNVSEVSANHGPISITAL